MQTGNIADWTSDPNLWGPLYPFVGTEMIWVIAVVIVWLLWASWQLKFEDETYKEEVAHLQEGNNLEDATGEYQVAPHPFFTE